jgi:hypothetical protein
VQSVFSVQKGGYYAESVYPRLPQCTNYAVRNNQSVNREVIEKIFQYATEDPEPEPTLLPALVAVVRSAAEEVIDNCEKMAMAGLVLIKTLGVYNGCGELLGVYEMERAARQKRRELSLKVRWISRKKDHEGEYTGFREETLPSGSALPLTNKL